MIREHRLNPLAISCICVVLIIVLRTMTDTGIIYGIYYLGVVFWTYLSAVMYFADSEFTAGRKPFVAMIHDRIFNRENADASAFRIAKNKKAARVKKSAKKAAV